MGKSKHKYGEPGKVTRSEPLGRNLTAEEMAKAIHESYERLAPKYGYEMYKGARKFDKNSPNGKLMIAVCTEVIERGRL